MKNTLMGEEGVSPVIAVILLVAITVVLSAVLYVMVSNMLYSVGATPTVIMKWVEDESLENYTGNVMKITGGDPPKLTQVTVVYTQGSETKAKSLDEIKSDNMVVGNMTMTFNDINNNKIIGAEDTFHLSNVQIGDTIRLVYVPTAGEMYRGKF